MAIDFRLFGGVSATRDGEPVALGPVLPRTVLAVLLLDANTAISLDDLTARVWGDAAPSRARSSLHGYFTRLRSVLGDDGPIVRRGLGYALVTDRKTVDVHRFRAAIRPCWSPGSDRVARRPSRRRSTSSSPHAAVYRWR